MRLLLLRLNRVGVVMLSAGILFGPAYSLFAAKHPPAAIVDFHPTTFDARADAPFFYSIGDEFKFSTMIDPNAPTLFRGKIDDFQVSPDGKRIALVSAKKLSVLGFHGDLQTIGAAESIYREFKPRGRTFIREDGFQWSPDSISLYFIKDTFHHSKGSQLFSKFGELWRFNVQTGDQQLVLKPFPAFQIIFGKGSDIYFAVPVGNGDLQLESFDGTAVRDITVPRSGPAPGDGSSGADEHPFFSFSSFDYREKILPGMDLLLGFDRDGNRRLTFQEKTLLELTRTYDFFDGWFDCADMLGSVFLPGNRYFLLNVPYCHNYGGQLLIDVQTGVYKTLPKDTRVYVTANTQTYPHYKFNGTGIDAE